jgi:hypothetical protein
MIFEKFIRDEGRRSSMTISELQTILGHIEKLCESAGAKSAKDLQAFSEMLKPYSDVEVGQACAEIKRGLSQAAERPAKRVKTPVGPNASASNTSAVQSHLTELRSAGIDRVAFDLALKNLKESKSIKSADLSDIARQFSLSVTKYKSKAAAYADIEDAFIQQARFERKIR